MSVYVNTHPDEPEPFTPAEHRAQAMRLLHQAGVAARAGGTGAVSASNMLRAARVHAELAFVALMEAEAAWVDSLPPVTADPDGSGDVDDPTGTELAS